MAVNANFNQKQADPNAPGASPLQTIGSATPAAPVTTSQAPTAPKPQGSGRFTNIQKYLNANQQGGQKIAGQVESNLNKTIDPEAKKAQDYYAKLGQSVSQANQVTQAGQGYQQQLQGIGSQIKSAQDAGFNQRDQANLGGIEQFTQQPGFKQFQEIQAGRGINENLLALQQQQAANTAANVAQATGQAKQALGSEGGRFNLLRQTFDRNGQSNYGQGLQRLDQSILGQGQGLNSLQSSIQGKDLAAQKQAALASGDAAEVTRLAQAEKGLIGDINSQTGKNSTAYEDMLKSYTDPLNEQRHADQADLARAMQSYTPNKIAQVNADGSTTMVDQVDAKGNKVAKPWEAGFSEDQMKRLGLTDSNQGVYNVFNNNTDTSKFTQVGRDAQKNSIQDVANASDVNRYKLLSQIAGTPDRQIKESELGASWTNSTDGNDLKTNLANAQAAFDKEAANKIYPNSSVKNVYATGADFINQGRDALRYNPNNAAYGPEKSYADELASTGNNYQRNILTSAAKGSVDNFQNLLNQQNYNRTLGGRRNTFLDTEAAANMNGTPKLDPTPITQQDPSLYPGINNLIKGK